MKSYSKSLDSVKPSVTRSASCHATITLVVRGQGQPVVLMSTSFAELMDALRPLCPDGKIFSLPQRLREAV